MVSKIGKSFFMVGLLLVAIGSFAVWGNSQNDHGTILTNPFTIPLTGFAIIVISFILMSYKK